MVSLIMIAQWVAVSVSKRRFLNFFEASPAIPVFPWYAAHQGTGLWLRVLQGTRPSQGFGSRGTKVGYETKALPPAVPLQEAALTFGSGDPRVCKEKGFGPQPSHSARTLTTCSSINSRSSF